MPKRTPEGRMPMDEAPRTEREHKILELSEQITQTINSIQSPVYQGWRREDPNTLSEVKNDDGSRGFADIGFSQVNLDKARERIKKLSSLLDELETYQKPKE